MPAFHGLEPRLALSYSSEGRNGQVGVGWTLSGLSTIERGRLDGQELLLCSAYPPAPGPAAGCVSGGGVYYFTKDESYLKIQRNGAPPYTFSVWGRDGTKTTLSPVVNKLDGTSPQLPRSDAGRRIQMRGGRDPMHG